MRWCTPGHFPPSVRDARLAPTLPPLILPAGKVVPGASNQEQDVAQLSIGGVGVTYGSTDLLKDVTFTVEAGDRKTQ